MLYADVLSIAKPNLPVRSDDMFNATICNMATELIWSAYDWWDSIDEGAPFYLVPMESDYQAPLAHIPVDFYGFRRVNLIDIESGNNTLLVTGPISQRRNLDLTGAPGIPSLIAWLPEVRAFRLSPRPAYAVPYGRYMVEYTYKKTWTEVTADNLHIALPLDDTMITAFVLAVIWAGAKLTGDQRTDQYFAHAMQEISRKAADFGLADGDVSVAPSEPLQGYGTEWRVWF
jgi:hypothetical protein